MAEELSPVEVYLNERSSGIGSSDVAPILGLSPYRTAVDVWREKVGDSPPDQAESHAIRRGRFLESAILSRYQREEGVEVATGRTIVDGWRRAQLDAVAADRIVEVKSVAGHVFRESGKWGDPGTDEIPDEYLCQVQWQLDLAGLEVAHVPVAVLPENPDRILGLSADEVVAECDLHVYIVRRSPEVCESIVQRCSDFWTNNVMRRIPPEPMTYDDARSLWWEVAGGSRVAADERTEMAMAALQFARGLGKIKDAIEARAKLEIAARMRDREILTSPDGEQEWLSQKVQKRRGYVVKPTETKVMRALKGWKGTAIAGEVETYLRQLESRVTAMLPPPRDEDDSKQKP